MDSRLNYILNYQWRRVGQEYCNGLLDYLLIFGGGLHRGSNRQDVGDLIGAEDVPFGIFPFVLYGNLRLSITPAPSP